MPARFCCHKAFDYFYEGDSSVSPCLSCFQSSAHLIPSAKEVFCFRYFLFCLSVTKVTQKLPGRFTLNQLEGYSMDPRRNV